MTTNKSTKVPKKIQAILEKRELWSVKRIYLLFK